VGKDKETKETKAQELELKKTTAETMDEIHRRWYALRNQGLDFSEYEVAAKELSEAVNIEQVHAIKALIDAKEFKENAEVIGDYYRDFEAYLFNAFTRKLLQNGEDFGLRSILQRAKAAADVGDKNAIPTIKALKKEVDDVTK